MDAVCPNCGRPLKSRPSRKKKCPHCGQYIYVRQGKLVGESQAIPPPIQALSITKPKEKIHPLVLGFFLFTVVLGCCTFGLVNLTNPDKKQAPIVAQKTTQSRSLAANTLEPTNTPNPTATPPPTKTPQPTSTPTDANTVEGSIDPPTPEALATPFIATEKDVNLRSGPGTNYEIIGALTTGQSFNIIGRNTDSSWWQIAVDDKPVWVAASVVKATNTDQEIEVVEAPPPPPTATATLVPAPVPTVAPTPTIIVIAPTPVIIPDAPPAGASAKCRDGTYSYSANRRGTCSHHGGVAVWY